MAMGNIGPTYTTGKTYQTSPIQNTDIKMHDIFQRNIEENESPVSY